MTITVSAALLLLVLVLLLVKVGVLKVGPALVAILFGFFLASTSAAPAIRQTVTAFVQATADIHL